MISNLLIIVVLILFFYIVYITFRVDKLEKAIFAKKIIESMVDGAEPTSGAITNGFDTEALNNIASLYNSGNFTVTNLTVTGKAVFGDQAEFSKPVTFKDKTLFDKVVDFSDTANFNKSVFVDSALTVSSKSGSSVLSPGVLKLGKEFEIETGNSTEFKNAGKSILSLPNKIDGTPVFRASGLAYTDKNTNINNYLKSKDPNSRINVSKLNRFFTTDPDRKSNLVFLGGMTKDRNANYRIVVGGRKYENKDHYFLETIADHGSGNTICPGGVGLCKADSSDVRL